MDVLQSRLAQHHSKLAKDIQALLITAQDLGANEGVQRVKLVCSQYDQLLPDMAYSWLDLNAFEREIEKARSHTAINMLLNLLRPYLIILPFILAFFSIFSALANYQRDLLLYPRDVTIPFFILWQRGFHNSTYLTPSSTIGTITLLLMLFLLSELVGIIQRRHAQTTAARFIKQLRPVIENLIEAIIADSRISSRYGDYATKHRQEIPRIPDMDIFNSQPFVVPSNTILGNESTLHVRILEEPLTALNFKTVISVITELHTKCWLIQQDRFSDLIDYTQTHDARFVREANLIITKLTLNSPIDIELAQLKPRSDQVSNLPVDIKVNVDASPKGIMEALRTAIDAVVQVTIRFRAAKLEIRARELEISQKDMEAQAQHTGREQNLQIESQKAELEKQKTLLEIERQKVEVERQHLVLQEERLELEKKRVEYALETANKIVDTLHPGIDETTKALLARTLLPNLLQLGNANGLELIPLLPENTQSTR